MQQAELFDQVFTASDPSVVDFSPVFWEIKLPGWVGRYWRRFHVECKATNFKPRGRAPSQRHNTIVQESSTVLGGHPHVYDLFARHSVWVFSGQLIKHVGDACSNYLH